MLWFTLLDYIREYVLLHAIRRGYWFAELSSHEWAPEIKKATQNIHIIYCLQEENSAETWIINAIEK